MDKTHDEILGMSHSYFSGREVIDQEIIAFIDRMKMAYPDANLDEAWLFRKIELKRLVVIGTATTLDDMRGHEDWFNVSINQPLKRGIEWHFWNHYRDYLEIHKGRHKKIVEGIDRLSREILSRIEDPLRPGAWDRRGMVMGSVQSGKTANYTALITKAADAGYKLIVVMAGVHNSLRSQTQSRLNEEFLGYDLDRIQKLTGVEKKIGVRLMFSDHNTVYTLTSSSEKGDFRRVVAAQSGIFPAKDGPPIVLVIKKHVSILKNLIDWIPSVIGRDDQTGKKVIQDIPLLLIDDECDYASINTKEPDWDEYGEINAEWNPTTTNRRIRELLFMFDKSVYIGYTATPYANIFIHMEETHKKYGEDLFPRSFIIGLPQPSNYMGPEQVFGLGEDLDRGLEEMEPLPLISLVDDYEDIIPNKHKKGLILPGLPTTMKYAIKTFLLSCAARTIRAEGNPHKSMLIHVSRFTLVQEQIYEMVEMELQRLSARIMSGNNLEDFREIWEMDFQPRTREMEKRGYKDALLHSWDDVLNFMQRSTRMVRVKLINGTVKDSLDYKEAEMYAEDRIRAGENVPWEERGASIIAIGGDKLSRGLTLEGLSVSYYLRASRMYDTLMQMGRWFGFKDDYNDLCRIFTTEELIFWYRHIAGATIELRREIDYMAALGTTPEKFGLKIRSHPGRLIVTSAGKSRKKQRVLLSYAGSISETVVFDPRHSANNVKALERLLSEIGRDPDYEVNENKPRLRWSNVSSASILNFLNSYRTREEAKRVADPQRWAQFIEKQNLRSELTKWDVVIVSNQKRDYMVNIGKYSIAAQKRKALLPITSEKISIKRLVSPADETLDLTEEEMARARSICGTEVGVRPSGKAIRAARPIERGLILIYLPWGAYTDVNGIVLGEYGTNGNPVIGLAVSFPDSNSAVPIEYWVNPIYQAEETHYT